MPLQLQYHFWTIVQKRQFRNALVRDKELPVLSVSGYYIDKSKLPKDHPARDGNYGSGDLLDASLELRVKSLKK